MKRSSMDSKDELDLELSFQQGYKNARENLRPRSTHHNARIDHTTYKDGYETACFIEQRRERLKIPKEPIKTSPTHLRVLESNQRIHQKLLDKLSYYFGDASRDIPPRKEVVNWLNWLHDERPTPTTQLSTTVVGLGPVGIWSALQAYLSGAKVNAVEKRTTYDRANMFRLDEDIFNALHDLFEADDDFNILLKILEKQPAHLLPAIQSGGVEPIFPAGDPFYQITINDFETITFKLLEAIAACNPESVRIYRGDHGYEYLHHDKAVGRNVYIRSLNPADSDNLIAIPTDVLVAADGANSKVRSNAGIKMVAMSDAKPYATFNFMYNSPVSRTDSTQRYRGFPQILKDGIDTIPSRALDGTTKTQWQKSMQAFFDDLFAFTSKRDLDHELALLSDAPQRVADYLSTLSNLVPEYFFQLRGSAENVAEIEKIMRHGVSGFRRKLAQQGWDDPRLPVTRYFRSTHDYLGVEIPQFLYEQVQELQSFVLLCKKTQGKLLPETTEYLELENLRAQADKKKSDLLEAWGKLTLEKHLPKSAIKRLYLRDCTAFEVMMGQAEQALKTEASGIEVYLAGDAMVFPHFQTGSGVINGIRRAEEFSDYVFAKQNIASSRKAAQLLRDDLEKSSCKLADQLTDKPLSRQVGLHFWNFTPTEEYFSKKGKQNVPPRKKTRIRLK